jgi:hypothetical protein
LGDRVQDFRDRIGLSVLPESDATTAVRADWRELPRVVQEESKDLRFDASEMIPLEGGVAQSIWDWQRGEERLSVEVYVSGAGSGVAREKLVDLASRTTTREIPYDPGPPGLGDLAIQHTDPPFEEVLWVFHNVCVRVDNQGTGRTVLPMVWRIQAFMEGSVVHRIAKHLPHIDGIQVSSTRVQVGETITIEAHVAPGQHGQHLITQIDETGERLLEPTGAEGLSAIFRAVGPGRAFIEINVIDPVTLLSSRLVVFVDVLPMPRAP